MARGFKLDRLGWSPFFQDHFSALNEPTFFPGRVVVENKHNFLILSERGESLAEVPGRMLHRVLKPSDLPKVGDFVALEWPSENERPIIRAVLQRKSQFVRQTGGKRKEEQVLAANIDLLFVIQGLDRDFNPRRLERYIVLAHESGCQPIILLNKIDLCDEYESFKEEVQTLFPQVVIFCICAKNKKTVVPLRALLTKGVTVAVVGSSGSGKSTLVNTLAGEDLQDIGEELEWNEKGKHTTVRRELLFLPRGAVIIDTPGIREVQLGDCTEGISAAFPDIEALTLKCKFSDCGHESEPGCAIRAALEEGTLSSSRLSSFQKLLSENERKKAETNPYSEKRRKEAAKKSERQSTQHHKSRDD